MNSILKLINFNLKYNKYFLNNVIRYESNKPAVKNDSVLLTTILEDEETEEEKEARINKLRDKSRLTPHHKNILNGKVPYSEPKAHYHESVKYKRRMFGRYGNQSNVYPGIAWPDKEDLALQKEYENFVNPIPILEMVQIEKAKIKEKEEMQKLRYKTISEKADKNHLIVQEFYERQNKKLNEEREAKEQKEKLFNEIRKHFGFNIDPRDEKFQEMLEIRKKEEAKQRRLEKKKMREEKLISLALEMAKEQSTHSSGSEGSKEKPKENNKSKENNKKE